MGIFSPCLLFCNNRYKTFAASQTLFCHHFPSLLGLRYISLTGTVVAGIYAGTLAKQELKGVEMPEHHPGASPLAEVIRIDCTSCVYRELLANGNCEPGEICVSAQSGRQIDRFFRRNPEFAENFLKDLFWERRAIAVRYAPVAVLRSMPRDKDEVVRRAMASRLPKDELGDYLRDPDREVRMTVANRLDPERLSDLLDDEDYLVRLQVAKRLPHGQLRRMADDEDREVRKEVARRLPTFALRLLTKDEDVEVRRIVAMRALSDDAELMLKDEDWVVRLEASRHAPLEAITELVDDEEPDVRAAVQHRLNDFLHGDDK